MAKTEGPLLSQNAHGSIGKILTYSHRNIKNIARTFHYPKKEPTGAQWTQRHIIGLLTAHWQVMTADEHVNWHILGAKESPRIPGFAKFIKDASADLYTHHGLMGYWSMNEPQGAQILDYSGQGNHGTLKPAYPTDNPTRATAMRKEYGNALNFDGVNDFVDCGNVINMRTKDMSILAWLKPREYALSAHYIVSKSRAAAQNYRYGVAVQATTGKPFIFMQGSGGDDVTIYGTTSIVNENWNYLAFIFDRDANAKIYINAEYNAGGAISQWNGADMNSNNPFRIGSYTAADNITATYFYRGMADEIQIYNRALGDEEIFKHYELLRLDKKRQPLLER